MRPFLLFTFVLTLALSVGDNPFTIWCDVHNTNFTKNGTVIRDGKCYDRYAHGYNEGLNSRTHEALLRCANDSHP